MSLKKHILKKLIFAFDKKLDDIKEKEKISNLELDPVAKFTGTDAIMSVRQTLLRDLPGKERLLDPNWNLKPFIYLKIKSIKKDINKLKQSKILARVIDPGRKITNEKSFQKNKFYTVRDIKRIEDLQIRQEKMSVRYIVVPQNNYFEIIIDDENNIAMSLMAGQELEQATHGSNQEDVIEEMRNKIKKLGEKCKKLLQEFSKRLDTSLKDWAQEKGVKYETLKLDYFRCKEKLRELYFPKLKKTEERNIT
jgi:hypothetical protein